MLDNWNAVELGEPFWGEYSRRPLLWFYFLQEIVEGMRDNGPPFVGKVVSHGNLSEWSSMNTALRKPCRGWWLAIK